MEYSAQSRPRTLVVAGMPLGRAVVRDSAMISPGPAKAGHYNLRALGEPTRARILVDQRAQQHGGMLRMDGREMRHLVAAGRAGGCQHVSRLQIAPRGQQPPLTNLPRDLIVVLGVAKGSGHAAAA